MLADGLEDDQCPKSDGHSYSSTDIWSGSAILLSPVDYQLVDHCPFWRTFLTEPDEGFDK
jgi:hypothetical protein